MAPPRIYLPDADIERIYQREIRPAYLTDARKSKSPAVVFVAGTPGSGTANAMRRVNAQLKLESAPGVIVSVDDMRVFHPGWIKTARNDVQAAARYDADAGKWVDRLYRDAIGIGSNVAFEAALTDAAAFEATSSAFRYAGYRVEVTVLAVDQEATKRAMVAGLLDAQLRGGRLLFFSAEAHERAFSALRSTLAAIETAKQVDALRIVNRAGEPAYSNTVRGGQWVKEPAAVAALDRLRNRPKTPAEIAQNALAWHALVAQAQAYPNTPREVGEQVVGWRKQATEQALASEPAAKHYQNGLAAEAFRTMEGEQFLREFPEYEGAISRLQRARDHASRDYPNTRDQHAFVLQARERLAEYIAQGRQFARLSARDIEDPLR